MKKTFEQVDLRVRRTHKLLWEALMAELSERAFEEITVTDICERAMVHRTTFYKHYEDKYALLEQGMRQMYGALLAEGHIPPSAFSMEDPPPYFIRLFEHAAQHQHFYKLMLCGEGIGRFQKLVKEYIVEVASAKMRELTPTNHHLAVPLAMQVQFFAGGALSLLAWWLENDMPLSPHQMAKICCRFTALRPINLDASGGTTTPSSQAFQELVFPFEMSRNGLWRETLAKRAGVEGTISLAIRAFELRPYRNIVLAQTHLLHLFTAVAINLVCFDTWQNEIPRTSRFAALALASSE